MSDSGERPEIRTESRGRSLWIWIDREERRNAINKSVIQGIERAVIESQQDESLRGIVLTGAGRKAFCAGADLTGGTDTFTRGLDEPMTDFGKLARVIRNIGVPLIGRINGDCVAGGMGLMSLCDLIVVADHARFGLPEAKVGVFPMQVMVFLRGMIGARHINELCLTGELIDAGRAREIGIANYVVPFEQLDCTNRCADSQARRNVAGRASPGQIRHRRHGKHGFCGSAGICGNADLGNRADRGRNRRAGRVQRASGPTLENRIRNMSERLVRIGGASGAWGDSPGALAQLINANVDYLIMDYLAEVTMSLLARARMKDPQAGYPPDFIAYLKSALPEIGDEA